MNSKYNPILVTGHHRSGTTWVGKILATAPRVAYIHEPFNPQARPGFSSKKFDIWFPYIHKENEHIFFESLYDTVHYNFHLVEAINYITSTRNLVAVSRDFLLSLLYKIINYRPLLKDPIALLSADWLSDTFNMDVVVMIRHPAAFALSLKRIDWPVDFSIFTNQTFLMETLLSELKDEIISFSKRRHDIIDQSSLLWKIFAYVIFDYKKRRPDWLFIRNEDLSTTPMPEFKKVFSRLNLKFTRRTENLIKRYTQGSLEVDLNTKEYLLLERNSKSSISTWKKALTKEETDRIRKNIGPICSEFYPDFEW